MSSQHDTLADYEAELVKGILPIPISNALQIELEPDKHSRLVFLTDPGGLAAERYKVLRRHLRVLKADGGIVLLTSPAPADGKTLTSVNLAFSLAEQGHSTCLVDLDFRAPGIFGTLQYSSDAPDVLDILQGRATILQAIRRIGADPLYLLGIQEGAHTSSFQLDREAFRSFLFRLRAAFTWVILDLAPAIPFSDVSEVLPHVDGALMVVRAEKTKKSLVGPSLEVLGSKLWGVVLNDAAVRGDSCYGYYNYGDKSGRRSPKKAEGRHQAIQGISLKS
jgi:capsular exopolysaccharide synthesis family protein